MKRDYIDFQDRSQPLGYLITIRCYGTWLHGDERGSMNRRSFNKLGEPMIPANSNLEGSDRRSLANPPIHLNAEMRYHVEQAMREVCGVWELRLAALHVRTEHAHIAVGTNRPPEKIMTAFKSYATRRLRAHGLVGPEDKVWSRHGSTRYLWTEDHMATAADYVIGGQGGELPRFE